MVLVEKTSCHQPDTCSEVIQQRVLTAIIHLFFSTLHPIPTLHRSGS